MRKWHIDAYKNPSLNCFHDLKAIENVPSGASHKVLDVIVLLMSHAIANRKKPVEAIFRRKVRQGHFTEELLQATFTSHAQVGINCNMDGISMYFSKYGILHLLSKAKKLVSNEWMNWMNDLHSYSCKTFK